MQREYMGTDLAEAARYMREENVRRYPVTVSEAADSIHLRTGRAEVNADLYAAIWRDGTGKVWVEEY